MKPQGQIDSMVPNMAVPDTFMAPDSTASRPNPGTKADRPLSPNQVPASALEDHINHHERNEK